MLLPKLVTRNCSIVLIDDAGCDEEPTLVESSIPGSDPRVEDTPAQGLFKLARNAALMNYCNLGSRAREIADDLSDMILLPIESTWPKLISICSRAEEHQELLLQENIPEQAVKHDQTAF